MIRTFRRGLELVPPYRAGKPPIARADVTPFKLSSNENPFPPLPAVEAAIRDALGASISTYPQIAAPELLSALGTRFDVEPEQIALGAGSVEVAAQIIHALTSEGDEVMYAWRSFEAYPILTRVAGAVPVEVPLGDDSAHDLPAMAAAVTDRTRVIFICNPNNPTGTTVSADALDEFLQTVPSRVLVVVDEAYVHFNTDPNSAVGLDLFRRYDNVAVLHTFSKAYGLAGLRVGYAIAPAEVVAELRKTAIPFAVTALAQAAAVASLEAEAELQARVDTLVVRRGELTTELERLGLPVVRSSANFVWVKTGAATAAVEETLAAHSISARAFPGEGVRISIGEAASVAAIVRALASVPASELASVPASVQASAPAATHTPVHA
ncbi:histidinol-phosphate transaminase [Pseudoclavibacter sp. AY1F1]|uniref:histidinol-phosphate transaminase n=1 Tax=Pseudoclavibacter sp. AY1F1 TaxID=2080583 RepID=UPI000CE7F798|nr:histidinol-phosphate transaminase [Pseudoclavibacter sp. AY1F1]PPF44957.1 histidinol-phosphate transaminase [Pseudoclavibacter sp. AY1F1]